MPLYKMAGAGKSKEKAPAEAKKASPDSPEKKRPGTSGTEAGLVVNRRQASENFQRAQRAERACKAKKRSATGRANYKEAKAHFRESGSHLKQGVQLMMGVVKSVPYVFNERRERLQVKTDAKRRQRALEQKKRLEVTLAKEAENGEDKENVPEAA